MLDVTSSLFFRRDKHKTFRICIYLYNIFFNYSFFIILECKNQSHKIQLYLCMCQCYLHSIGTVTPSLDNNSIRTRFELSNHVTDAMFFFYIHKNNVSNLYRQAAALDFFNLQQLGGISKYIYVIHDNIRLQVLGEISKQYTKYIYICF